MSFNHRRPSRVSTLAMISLPNFCRYRTLKSTLIATSIFGLLTLVFFALKPTTNQRADKGQSTSAERANPHSRQFFPDKSSTQASQIGASEFTSQLPLSFEANHGQTDRQVKFLARGRGYGLFLTATEAVFSLQHGARETSSALRMTLKNANRQARARGSNPLPGVANY